MLHSQNQHIMRFNPNFCYWDSSLILVPLYMTFHVYKLTDRVLKFKIRYYHTQKDKNIWYNF